MNRHASRFLLILALAPCLTGCATNYMKNRWHDTKDVVTLTIGAGFGVKAHAGLVGSGNILALDLAGLRGGDTVWGGGRESNNDSGVDGDLYLFPLGIEIFAGEGDSRSRGKSYAMFSFFGLCVPLQSDDSATTPIPVLNIASQNPAPPQPPVAPEDNGLGIHGPSLTQIEAAAGFGPMVRAGFNVGELLDFLLGWTTLDFYGDDIAGRTEAQAPTQTAPQPAPAAASPAPAEPAPQDAKTPI